jgi:hypothetical protein
MDTKEWWTIHSTGISQLPPTPFGAHLYLFFGVDEANLSGQLGLDVLFQLVAAANAARQLAVVFDRFFRPDLPGPGT